MVLCPDTSVSMIPYIYYEMGQSRSWDLGDYDSSFRYEERLYSCSACWSIEIDDELSESWNMDYCIIF